MDLDSIIGLVIIFSIGIFLFLDRKNIEIHGPLLLRKTKNFNKKIERISLRFSKFFNIFGVLAIISVYVSFALFFYFSLIELFKPPKIAPIQVVLPSLPMLCNSSFVLCVPAYFWFIIIPIIAISHELAHAFLARISNLRIKSMGYAFLLVLPAFFVELDEKKLKKIELIKRLKIYAAGSFANFIVGILALLLLIIIANIIFLNFGGVEVEILDESSGKNTTLTILKINNEKVDDVTKLAIVMKSIRENKTQNVTIQTINSSFDITINESIKIRFIKNAYYPKNEFTQANREVFLPVLLTLREFLFWLFFLNIGIGMFNLLPIKPLDGGLFFYDLLEEKFGKKGEVVFKFLSTFTILLLLLLILKSIFKF